MKQRFGKGRGVLSISKDEAQKRSEAVKKSEAVEQVDVSLLVPGKYQPRRVFDETALSEMEDSIRQHGIEQPIIVRPKGDVFEIIAGERRWRGAKLAGLLTVPCIIRDYTDKQASVVSLVENLQRKDLSPIEEAFGYKQLKTEFDMTDQKVAEVTGKSRSTVTNMLRLLRLCIKAQQAVMRGQMDMGHARALIPLTDEEQEKFTDKIISAKLSVRQVEKLIRQKNLTKDTEPKDPAIDKYERDIQQIASRIQSSIGKTVKTRVHASGKVNLDIEIEGLSQLMEIERLLIK